MTDEQVEAILAVLNDIADSLRELTDLAKGEVLEKS